MFIEKWSSKSASNVKEKEEISKDYFWFLSEFWIYLLLLCLPLEVILRRWNVLFPSDTNISGVNMKVEEKKKLEKLLSKKIQQLNDIVADLDGLVTEFGTEYYRLVFLVQLEFNLIPKSIKKLIN